MKLFVKIGLVILVLFLRVSTVYAEDKSITFQGQSDYPPYTYEKDGYLTGFEMDLANLIFKSTDYDVKYSKDSLEEIYSRVKNGEIDTCGLLAINEQRKEEILFTKPILHFYIAIFTRNDFEKVTIENLAKFKVGLGKGYFSEYIYKEKVGAENYIAYNTLEDAIEALNKGEIDVLFENQEVINYLVIQKALNGRIIPQQDFLFRTDVAYGVTKTNQQLVKFINQRLDELVHLGIYEELYEGYFLKHSEIYENDQKKNIIVLLSIVILTIISIYVTLRLYIEKLKKKIVREQEFSKNILRNSKVFIIAFRMDGTILKFNRYAESITGCNAQEVLGKVYTSACKDCSKCQKIVRLFEEIKTGIFDERKEICIVGANNQKITFVFKSAILNNEKGKADKVVFIGLDISENLELQQKLQDSYMELEMAHEELIDSEEKLQEQYEELKKSKDELYKMAYKDPLTRLPNRRSFYENLRRDLKKYPVTNKALLFIDSDNFKHLNDTLGHSYGDLLITEIGSRLSSMFSSDNVVYRLGGDEFIVYLYNYVSCVEVEKCAEKIIQCFEEPLSIGDSLYYTSVSIGVALYPEHGTSTDELIKRADIAMYKAKETGKNRYVFYLPSMDKAINERMLVEKHLYTALNKNEFLIYYQPQFDIDKNKISGFEALIRWQNPELGFVSPVKFINVAEDTHLIIPIGEWVLRNACLFVKKLHNQGYTDLTMSVNISMMQLLQEDFVDRVKQVIEFVDLNPQFLELEITESILMESYEAIGKKLEQLQAIGIKIALDDFGQGYSSLSYLKQLPIATLKIDKIFVDSINEEKSLIDMIIMMGQKMELTVVAEGVETKEQLEYLKNRGCHKIQGYFFSKPLPQEEAERLIKERGKTN